MISFYHLNKRPSFKLIGDRSRGIPQVVKNINV